MYIGNKNFRTYCDIHFLNKIILEKNAKYINYDENESVYVYKNRIAKIGNNKVEIYSQDGKMITSKDVTILKPLVETNEDYMLVADENGGKIYLFYKDSLQWQKDVEKNKIYKLYVNKDGSCVICSEGTTYKSVLTMYGITGDEYFKTYLSNSIVNKLAISENGKYLAYSDIEISDAKIKNTVKVIQIENAISGDDSKDTKNYELDSDEIICDLNYISGELIGITDKRIISLEDNKIENIKELNDKIIFVGEDSDIIAYIEENNNKNDNGEYILKTINEKTKKECSYMINSDVRDMTVKGNKVCINLGYDVLFLNNKGIKVKEYQSDENIQDIKISENLGIIIYKDKIKIVKI